MRILIVSYAFPPFNDIGHVRVGKTAKYLEQLGHDLRVLTAGDQPHAKSLPVEIDPAHIVSTAWWNVNRPAEVVFGGRATVARRGLVVRGRARRLIEWLRRMYRQTYKACIGFPDDCIGWYPFAVRAGSRLVESWRPDVIYASAMPYTSLLVAARLSREYEIPWVAELRDLWVDFHRYRFGRMRRWVEGRLERRVLSSATGFVTVSEPLAATLRTKYGKPTAVVLNGFDGDYEMEAPPPATDSSVLRIVYTGIMYEGRQDPSPLFAALRDMGMDARGIRVEFYGRYLEPARETAARFCLQGVVVNGQVSYAEAIHLQRQADVLLLLLWTDINERGVYTGKIFEYVGARRPILGVGPSGSVASDLLSERGLGFSSDDPALIRGQLVTWLKQKQAKGCLPSPPSEARQGLSRLEQTRILDEFLRSLVVNRSCA